jgi:hypothetical protein
MLLLEAEPARQSAQQLARMQERALVLRQAYQHQQVLGVPQLAERQLEG